MNDVAVGENAAADGHPAGPQSDVAPGLDPSTTETAPLEVVVVTGLSGAGKNSAGRVFEDLGWFVVDNLPPALLLPMVQLGARGDLRRFAAVVDVRSRAFSSDLQEAIRVLAEAGHRPRVVYVHARDEVLVRRYESNRREHPLQGSGTLTDGIQAERGLLTGIAGEADLWVDTSDLNVHQLRATLENAFARDGQTPPLTATVAPVPTTRSPGGGASPPLSRASMRPINALRDVPTIIAHPSVSSSRRRLSSSRLWSSVLPKPIPGSTQMRSLGIPAATAFSTPLLR